MTRPCCHSCECRNPRFQFNQKVKTMFKTILTFELKYWLRQPSVYAYVLLLFGIAALAMHGVAGGWDVPSATPQTVVVENSPLRILQMIQFYLRFVVFLIPAIFGVAIYRDFSSNMHTLLYAFPFTKRDYLSAKFVAATLIFCGIAAAIGCGIFAGTQLPGVDPAKIAAFDWQPYLHIYSVYVIPNVLFFGSTVFATVALTRNIYAGFIVIVLLFFGQALAENLLTDVEHPFWAALLDPFGETAAVVYTKYWTLAKQNANKLPLESLIVVNRIFWLTIAAVIFTVTHRFFSFSQTAVSVGFRRRKTERAAKQTAAITPISLPEVRYDFSRRNQLKMICQLAIADLKYMLNSWMFISILLAGIAVIFFQQAQTNPQYGFKLLPVTWLMLRIPAFLFSGVINLLTFLYAGMLVQRAKIARMNQLLDVTPVSNGVLLLSKWLALICMQLLLLAIVMLTGIAVQALNGFHDFEIGQYLFALYGLNLQGHIIWAFAAIFVQTVFTNPYLGLFLLLMGSMGVAGLSELGIEHLVFKFNISPDMIFSDMNGYGADLLPFFIYKIYWGLLGVALLFGAYLFWIRGLPESFRKRVSDAIVRFREEIAAALLLLLVAFLATGSGIYYYDAMLHKQITSAKQERQFIREFRQTYGRFAGIVQPRITDVTVEMQLFPESQNFVATGEYILVNRAATAIDTLVIKCGFDEQTEYHFNRHTRTVVRDIAAKFDVLTLVAPLLPGDSLRMQFEFRNLPNTIFQRNSNVLANGTFLGSDAFPRFGYRDAEATPHPADAAARRYSYMAMDSDYLNFSAVVSTSADQIAIAPGDLIRQWSANGRQFFHYQTDHPIKFYFGFNSARYAVMRDRWNDVELEIFHHPAHTYNLDRMMRGLKASLDYHSENFSEYQHKQARIIEFPLSEGSHATTFATSIPFSEYRFLIDVDDRDPASIDFPFYVAAHELAHQWWGNQVIPANALGAKMITESLAEYASLKILERTHGKAQIRKFLRYNLERYLKGRTGERKGEVPLILCRNDQEYIAYGKGALAFYALSEYIGEEHLHRALRGFLERNRFAGEPYPTAPDLRDAVSAVTPDSLHYLIRDMFETVTFYDNNIIAANVTELANGQFLMELELSIRKYRVDGQRQIFRDATGDSLTFRSAASAEPVFSLPLGDFVEIAVFGETKNEESTVLYRRQHKFSEIHNVLQIVVDQPPAEIWIDPDYRLIDANPGDNWERIK